MTAIRGSGAVLMVAAVFAALSAWHFEGLSVSASSDANPATSFSTQDWPVYGGQSAGDHYSPLAQINRENVHSLKVAWTLDLNEAGGLQTNPLIIEGRMFAYTPSQTVIALDAATGKKLWTFSAQKPGLQPTRGLSYWTDGNTSILFAAALDQLFALNPATGERIRTFGDNGAIDLRKGLIEGDYTRSFVALTTPGVIYKDMIIVGGRLPEAEPALPGDIRAFDVHTGELRWTFHTIPHPGEPGYDTWPKDGWKTSGAANNWTGMALDESRGIVYAPTGSAVSDFYGDDRIGNDLFADSLLALDANTGKLLWHFQGVHHDIWDRDFPSPPSLVTVRSGDKNVDAVAQTTKEGFLFLFDRVTGKPLFPIEEHKFPASNVPGEQTSPTQPVPLVPAPYARQLLTEDLLTTRTPEAHAWALANFKTFKGGGLYVPLSVDAQTIIFPGFDGGAEWGGSAVDPNRGIIYINSNDVAWTGGLTAAKTGGTLGSRAYDSQCAVCHGTTRNGSPPAFPSLVNVRARLSDDAITNVIQNGKGRMPSFPGIDGEALTSMLNYLKTEPERGTEKRGLAAATLPSMGGNRTEAVGAAIYDERCAICHSDDLMGTPSNDPGLIGVRQRMPDAQILKIVHDGKGRMPAFPNLTAEEDLRLLKFLGGPALPIDGAAPTSSKQEMESAAAGRAVKYRFTGYQKFLDPDGYPAVAPPWGTLNAIDLNTGKYLWKIPFGEYPQLAARGMANTGSENYGGPVVTAGGVVIIAATIFDRKIRAFDSSNGKLLWEAELPYAGNATPATYMVNGKQYIVIATSAARDSKARQGSAYVAFALP